MSSVFGKYLQEIIIGAGLMFWLYCHFNTETNKALVIVTNSEPSTTLTFKNHLLKNELTNCFRTNLCFHMLAGDCDSCLHPDTYLADDHGLRDAIYHSSQGHSYSVMSSIFLCNKTLVGKKKNIRILLNNNFLITDGDRMLANELCDISSKFGSMIIVHNFPYLVKDVNSTIIKYLIRIYQIEFNALY